ncbi:hypothetical protein BDQ17DRAFT_1536047 [Cyathus striatus]|nr:hypothetical protein BDQ17DRAFT_1536047 [Cyathus striatus]
MAKKKAVSEEETFVVEVITKARVVNADDDEDKKGKRKRKHKEQPAMWEYYVKWEGYDSDANTWEPEANLTECERLLRSFWEHIGVDNEDYQIGYVVEAKDDWIQAEKRYFAKQLAKDNRRKGKKKEEKKYKKLASTKKQKTSASTTQMKYRSGASELSNASSSSSEDDQPLRIVIPPPTKRKRLTTVVQSDEESDRDPTPTRKATATTTNSVNTTQEDRPLSPSSLFSGSASSEPSSPEIPLSTYPQHQPNAAPATQSLTRTPRLPVPPSQPGQERKSTLSAAKVKVMFPKHLQTKASGLPPEGSGLSRGISTKQRVAQGALQPTLARAPPPIIPKAKTSAAPKSSNPLASLSFKKTTATPVVPDRLRNSHVITKQQDFGRSQQGIPDLSNSTLHEPAMVTSPKSSGVFSIEDTTSGDYNIPSVPERRSSLPRIAHHTDPSLSIADTWLKENLPDPVAAPLRPSIDAYDGPPPPSSLYRKEPAGRPNISKIWTWSGSLTSYSKNGTTKIYKLEFSSFYNANDMSEFLSACKYPTQFAFLGPQEDDGVENGAKFSTIVRYMSKHRKVVLVPARLDGEIVSHILLFPSSLEIFRRIFEIPSEGIGAQGMLIAAHIPWALTPNLIQANPYKPPSRDRAYCIWNEGVQGSKTGKDPETKLLQAVLRECPGARDVGHKSDIRVVFVHVGALRTLHKLPGLTERRLRVASLQFYTYGTHPTVCPEIWGIREIYPCGGIVTFSPSALLGDPITLLKQIRRLNQHDLWECYILPSALGMAAKLACGQEDPLINYDSGKFALRYILEAIEQGLVALLRSPPAPLIWTEEKTVESSQWITRNMTFSSYKARKALEMSLDLSVRNFQIVPG